MAKDSKKSKAKSNKRKLNLKGKVTLVLGILAVVAIVAVGVVYSTYKSYYNKMNYQATVERTELGRGIQRILNGDIGTLMWSDHVYNVLLIGDDSYRDDGARSDAMILVSINQNTQQINLVSFMRDSWVHIPGHGAERLNQAYAIGGPLLLMDTIETNFHVRIDNYVQVDFYAFIDVVDALGGVEIDVTEEEVPVLNNPYITHINRLLERPREQDWLEHSGVQTLNGVQALSYARIRYMEGSDFARTERQRKVISACFDKFKDASVAELLNLLEVVLPHITTDISEDKMLGLLADTTTKYKDYEIVQYRVPYDDTWEDWIHELTGETKDVLSIDIETNSQYLIRDLYGIEFLDEDVELDNEEIIEGEE